MQIRPFDEWTVRGRWWPTLRRAQKSSAVVVHHSVTTVGPSMLGAVRQVEAVIYGRRLKSRFSMIAYSYLITPDGTVWEGRGTKYRNGANNDTKRTGYGNAVTLSVCFVGNYHPSVPGVATVHPTDPQITAAADLIRHLADTGELWRGYEVVPHRHVHYTACPGDLLVARIDEIAAAASRHPSPPAPSDPSDTGGPAMIYQYGLFSFLNEGWRLRLLTSPGSVAAFKAAGVPVVNLTGERPTIKALLNEANTAGRLHINNDTVKALNAINAA